MEYILKKVVKKNEVGVFILSVIFSLYQLFQGVSSIILLSYFILWYVYMYNSYKVVSNYKEFYIILYIFLFVIVVFMDLSIPFWPLIHFFLYISYIKIFSDLNVIKKEFKCFLYGFYVYIPFILYAVNVALSMDGYSKDSWKLFFTLSLFILIHIGYKNYIYLIYLITATLLLYINYYTFVLFITLISYKK